MSEPRRLLRRYLKYNTLFLYYLVRESSDVERLVPAPLCSSAAGDGS